MVAGTGLTLECTSAPAISAAVGTIDTVTIKTDPTVSGVTELQVPLTEAWVLTDCYVLAAAGYGTTQPMVNFDKNRGRSMGTTPSLAAMLVTSNTRPRFAPSPIGFEGGSIMRMFTITTVVNTTPVDSITFYVAVSIA